MIFKSLLFFGLLLVCTVNANEDELTSSEANLIDDNLIDDNLNDDNLIDDNLIDDTAFERLFEELESNSERKWKYPRIAKVELSPGNGSSVQGKLKLYQFEDELFIRGKIYGLDPGNTIC